MNKFHTSHKQHQQLHDSSSTSLSLIEMASKYYLEDLPGASIPGSRITKILKQVESETPLSNLTLEYLRKNGFLALLQFAKNEISFTDFLKIAEPEQLERRALVEEKTKKEEAERQLKRAALLERVKQEQERVAAKKRAYDNDPRNVAKAKQNELRHRYDLAYYIEKEHFPKLMDILRRVDKGLRLTEKDIIWLTTKDYEYGYYTTELRERYHSNEADFYVAEFRKNKDPWCAVNASSHFRKCERAEKADSMLRTINISKIKNKKLKSALCTTHGGVKRDLRQHSDALVLGERAHQLTPKDFRPCTLLGAVNMELGHHSLGESWYEKAIERGASEKSVDDDLRSIFLRADPIKQKELRVYLLNKDPERYSWVKTIRSKRSRSTG